MPIYPAIYDGPPHNFTARWTKKRYIAIHNTSNDASAEAEASYAKRRTDSVSSHYYCDPDSLIQSLNTDYRAWHAGSTEGNDFGIAYELTGTNAKTRTWWLANLAWGKLAAQIAVDCAQWGIVPQTLTITEIRAGTKTGVITHDQMRHAWGGTDHTDPGPNFPMDYLLAAVRAQMEGDMQLTDQLGLPLIEGNTQKMASVASALGYDLVRNTATLATVKRLEAGQAAILAAVRGDDDSAILAKLDEMAAAEASARAQERTVLVADVVAALTPLLSGSGVTQEMVEAALRSVLGSVDETPGT